MAFATVSDLELRWHIPEGLSERAEALLEDAAVLIESEMRAAHIRVNKKDKFQESALKIVSCSVVKRVLASSQDGDYSQISRTAGSFNEQFTFSNPSGDMYLTAREKSMLGITQGRSRIAQIGIATKGGRRER